MTRNCLYYGDNLDILRRYVPSESVDLVYLDPPFKSNQDYNVLFQEQDGRRAQAQIKVFEDTWRWDQESARAFQEVVELGGSVSRTMQGLHLALGTNDLLAYLTMMAPRLVELQRVLKTTGSIYLHCDPTASHYLKMLMDAVFGPRNFRNEIVWCYTGPSNTKAYFPRKHDIVLFYSQDARQAKFYSDAVRIPYKAESFTMGGSGSLATKNRKGDYTTGREEQLAKGKIVEDYWIDIPSLSVSKERLGYPTQKPAGLLERIIKANSLEGDVILDPFCGCGTAIAEAQRLNRRWIGIDITHLAITLIRHRLRGAFGEIPYDVIGEPISLTDAQTLARDDPYQFQWWALGLVGARPTEQKKGSDRGIDGRLYFHDEAPGAKTKQIILQVKSGHVNSAPVRDLVGVLTREQAAIGVLVTLQPPTQPMRSEAASAGFYRSPGWHQSYPRLQILSIEELLAGKKIDYPPQTSTTFKPAPRAKPDQPEQPRLL